MREPSGGNPGAQGKVPLQWRKCLPRLRAVEAAPQHGCRRPRPETARVADAARRKDAPSARASIMPGGSGRGSGRGPRLDGGP
jgi:hypothetical protein